MTKILDQSGDVNFRELYKFAKLYPLPDFVKKAGLQEIVGPEEKRHGLYADPRATLQFPCHTKAATVVSYLYFLEKQAEITPKIVPLIADRFTKFAKYWGIANTLNVIQSKYESLTKSASLADSDYAIVWATDDGRKERRYPLRNNLEVKAAAAWFGAYLPQIREQFGFLDRQTIATKILDKAAEFGAGLGTDAELLEKCAGRGLCAPEQACKALRDRVKAAHKCSKEVETNFCKLAELVEREPRILLDPEHSAKLADTIDQFDRTHGLLNRYTVAISSPEDVLFGVTHTKAAGLCKESCSLVTGAIYDSSDFSKLSATDVEDLLGEEIAQAVCLGLHICPTKMAEVAMTLPRTDAVLFEQLLTEKGISPMAKQASTYTGFTPNQLAALAN